MFKRILAVIMVVCLLPAMVYAATWSLNTQVKTVGGTIQIDNGPLQTSAQGSVFNYYTTSSTKTVKVAPDVGIMVTAVNLNGTVLTNPTETSFTVGGPNAQVMTVSFAQLLYNIKATVTGVGGRVTGPTGVTGLASGTVLTTAKSFYFTPDANYIVDGITGIPAGASQVPAVPVRGQAVRVTFPAGFVVTSNTNLNTTFSTDNPIAKSGLSQSAVAGPATIVTLDGSGSVAGLVPISSYSWTQTSGPAATLTNAGSAIAKFTPIEVGSYVFNLTIMPGGSTSSTTVTVYTSAIELAQVDCANCHNSSGNAVRINAYNLWSV